MKKIASIVTVISAFALVVCLAGCSSEESSVTDGEATINGAYLNKTVSVHGITYRVSSDWEEESDDGTVGDLEIGFNNYRSDELSLTMGLYYTNYDLNQTADEAIEEDMDDDSHSNAKYSEVSSSTLDSSKYTIYEYSYSSSGHTYQGCIAYIMGKKMHYEIDVRSGSSSLANLNAILNTVTID